MTLTLNLSADTEERLQRRAALAGQQVPEFVADIVEQAARADEPKLNMVDHLRAIGVVGAVKGKRRSDGRSWSEIEAACDTD